jgi:tetratricopeptide (TPR) repeat protein
LVATGTESPSAIYAERGRIRSQLAEKHKDYEAALKEFEGALKDFESALADPKADARIHLWKAHTLVQMAKADDLARKEQHYRDAEAALDSYLKSRKSLDVFRFRGLLRITLKRYSDAISDLTRALEAGDDPELLTERGWAHLVLNEIDAALEDFGKALDRNREYGRALNGRGLALLLKPNPTRMEVREAVRHAEKAQEYGPWTAFLFYDAARIYAQASARMAAEGYRGEQESSEYQRTAVWLLGQAISLAEFPTALGDMIMKDHWLAPIRSSPDFDRLKRRLFREPR